MATAAAPSKEALCIVVDVSHSMTSAQLASVQQTCSDFILQKMLYSPSDEVGLIFAGTNGTLNRLNTFSPNNYKNVTVMRPVMKPNGEFLKVVASAAAEKGPFDMFESILCAADLIKEATQDKKYNRRVMLISALNDPVQNKKAISEVQQGLSNQGINLVVIGVDFTDDGTTPLQALATTKLQNERVISIICGQLGEASFVFPIEDAMDALHSLRKRNVSERTTSRAILTIGDVKIAVYIYSKTLQARVPTLKKTSAAVDSSVTIDRRYFVASSMQEVDAAERIKVLKYGRSVVPCASMDEEQMKFISDRSLDCLGFINMSDIPPHILMGGCKAVGPAIGDSDGATALAAFVQGMVHLNKAMLVRFVRCANASPTVCACFPSSKPERHILYMVTLPFAEDFRRYLLPDFANITLTASEATAIDDMVTSMVLTPEDDVKVNKIYNPSLQQYYSWVRARYLQSRAAQEAIGGASTGSSSVAAMCVGKPLPPMPPAVRFGATSWGEDGNALHEKIAKSKPLREKVARDFPFTPPNALNAPGKEAKAYWFGSQGTAAPTTAAASMAPSSASAATGGVGGEGDGSPSAKKGLRTESGAPNHQYPHNNSNAFTPASASSGQLSVSDHYLSSVHTQGGGGGASSAGTTQQQQLYHNGGGGGVLNPSAAPAMNTRQMAAINTANPVESFLAMVSDKTFDLVDEAIFRMGELVITLIKLSIGSQFYDKCEQCTRALRGVCVKEDEPAAYFAFLQRLMLLTKGGTHDTFWQKHVIATNLGPITADESGASVMDAAAAAFFLKEGIKAPAAPVMDDDVAGGADDLLDLLE